MPNADPAPKVTIVGGGVAGLAAALRLVERGFAVEIFEKAPLMGGNLSAVERNGVFYDVYPHMFAEWYHNFWQVVEDIGLTKAGNFEKRSSAGFLRAGEFPRYHVCTDIGALATARENLSSGILTLPEMLLTNYTILDALVCGGVDPGFLNNQTLNDFVVNRPYATQAVTEFFDAVVNNIWSINSYQSSALAYERFAKFQFREPSPQSWVLKGDAYSGFVRPLIDKMGARAALQNNAEVIGATVTRNRVTTISWKNLENGEVKHHDIENLIIAANPAGLSELIFAPATQTPGARTIISLLPELANVRRLGSDPLPVLYVAFNRKLADIPDYYVALLHSRFSLTFVRIEYLSGPEKTVLAVAASDFDALPITLRKTLARYVSRRGLMTAFTDPDAAALKEAALPILNEFVRYVPFDIDHDVDWANTFFQPNVDQQLFVNQVGSQQWLTKVSYPAIENLCFAGNSCANDIMIATVESGVSSGLQAAQALVGRYAGVRPVPIIEPKAYPVSQLVLWKILFAPYAALAKVWVEADACRKAWSSGDVRTGARATARAATEWERSGESLLAEWVRGVEAFGRMFMR